MNEIPLKQIIDASLSQIGKVADVNTVIGDPITTEGGVTIVPFSKVSVGFASGGADFDGKNQAPEKAPHFAGANGAGVSVTPLGFIIIDGNDVRLLDIKNPVYPASDDPVSKIVNSVNTVVDKAPDLFAKIKALFAKDKKEEKEEEQNDNTVSE